MSKLEELLKKSLELLRKNKKQEPPLKLTAQELRRQFAILRGGKK